MNYVFDNAQEKEEFDRLQLIEKELDPDSVRRLESTMIQSNWNILEVGPGAGSVLKWLADQVIDDGQVTAVDLNPRFITSLMAKNIKVEKADISELKLKPESFDLVHGRYVFMHIKNYEKALRNVFQSLKPGGWLVVEEPDFEMAKAACQNDKDALAFNQVNASIQSMYTSRGIHFSLGRFIPEILQKMGFENIRSESTVHLTRGGTGMALMMKQSIAHLKDRLLATGKARQDEIDCYLRLCDDVNSWNQYYATIATLARK